MRFRPRARTQSFVFLVGTALSLVPLSAHAQSPPADTLRTPPVPWAPSDPWAGEAWLDGADLDAGAAEQTAERLADLRARPVNVNTAPAAVLAGVPGLSPRLAHQIVSQRADAGPFARLADLRAVPGLTPRRLIRAAPYLTVHASSPEAAATGPSGVAVQGLHVEGMHRVSGRLDLGPGYGTDTTRTRYFGPPTRVTTRLRADANWWSARVTLDRDPGEPVESFHTPHALGHDHVAGHLVLHPAGPVTTLILGDYSAEFGQGAALWRGLAFGKGRDATGALLRSGRGLVPFASTEENRFFRGVAAEVDAGRGVSAAAFASRRTLDATLGPVPEGATSAPVRTLPTSGLHRTSTERAARDAVRETTTGAALTVVHRGITAGITAAHVRFDRPLDPGPDPYRRFAPRGTDFTTVGVHATAFVGRGTLFGEAVRAPGGEMGGVVGGGMEVHPRAEVWTAVRVFPRHFQPLHAAAFREGSGPPSNEMGLYTGLRLEAAPSVTVSAYADAYRFPWLRFGVPRPTGGLDGRLVVEHTPRPWLTQSVQVRAETKDDGALVAAPDGRSIRGVVPVTRRAVRWDGRYAFGPQLSLGTRVEQVYSRRGTGTAETGTWLAQDVQWAVRSGLHVTGRLAFFDADSYDARLFAYEHDLRYSFSVPAFSGTGQRRYVLVRATPTAGITLEARYAVTRYRNVETVGSGLDEVPGSRLRDVGVQVRWKLPRH